MTVRTQLRLIALVAALFALVGLTLIAISYEVRRYWSPTPGVFLGSLTIVTAAVAARQLWRATGAAPPALAVAGLAACASVVAVPWLFPLVHASSEPPSFLEAYGYWTAVLSVAILAIVATWLARRFVRRVA